MPPGGRCGVRRPQTTAWGPRLPFVAAEKLVPGSENRDRSRVRALAVLLLSTGCASVEAASPLPAPPPLPDQSVDDERSPELEPAPELGPAPLPAPRTCREALSRAGVEFEDAPPSKHVVDFIKLGPVIAGITFRHFSNPEPRKLWVDCRLAERLLAATELLRARGVREVIHVGTYEPKCVGGGTPETRPGCTLSAHALGTAIDIAAFVREHDVVEVARDFVKRDGPTSTCLSPRGGERDGFLKELVCALDGTFSVLLTPNYNWDHRGHFHLAVHPPTNTPWSNGVDPPRPLH